MGAGYGMESLEAMATGVYPTLILLYRRPAPGVMESPSF